MCGRFALRASVPDLARMLGLEEPEDAAGALARAAEAAGLPRYNIAPSQPVLALRSAPDGRRVPVVLRWGLIPSWSPDPESGHRMINARIESVAERPAFRGALRARRCVVPASGFYEWQARPGRGKQPWFIGPAAHEAPVLLLAGLWERWSGPAVGGQGQACAGSGPGAIESCTILTTSAFPGLDRIHHRMPVVLAPGETAAWLHPEPEAPAQLLAALREREPPVELDWWPVSTRVNSPRHDDPDCMEPAPAGEDSPPGTPDLFDAPRGGPRIGPPSS